MINGDKSVNEDKEIDDSEENEFVSDKKKKDDWMIMTKINTRKKIKIGMTTMIISKYIDDRKLALVKHEQEITNI